MKEYEARWAKEQAVHALATSAMFDRRARDLKAKLQLLDYAGLIIPVIVGGLALAGIKLGSTLLAFASILAVMQSCVFLYALTRRWPDLLESSAEARRTNREQAELYDEYAKSQPAPVEWTRLESLRLAQSAQDEKAGLTEEEKRYGMRYALRQYQLPCATCQTTPKGLAPSECQTCGAFNKTWVK